MKVDHKITIFEIYNKCLFMFFSKIGTLLDLTTKPLDDAAAENT